MRQGTSFQNRGYPVNRGYGATTWGYPATNNNGYGVTLANAGNPSAETARASDTQGNNVMNPPRIANSHLETPHEQQQRERTAMKTEVRVLAHRVNVLERTMQTVGRVMGSAQPKR